MTEKKTVLSNVKAGIISRVDYGSSGFRMGLLKLAAETFSREKVHFIILAGGLISYKSFIEQIRFGKRQLRKMIKEALTKEEKADLRVKLEDFEEDFIGDAVNYLAENLPRVKNFNDPAKSWVKWYFVTSPGYDQELGNHIAHLLTKKRDDVVHWAHGYKLCSTEQANKEFAVITPAKAPWLRGKYHSTPVERTIMDWTNQNYSGNPHDLIVGCCGSTLQKPGDGEAPIPYIAVPVLCRLWDTRMGSENQVGVTILEYTTSGQTLVRNYNYNDVVAVQNRYIYTPKDANEQQQHIVELLKNHGAQTIGQLAHHLGLGRKRKELGDNLQRLLRKSATTRWPGLVLDEASGLYDFNPKWLETELMFPYPKKKRQKDSLVAFGCLHAGCVHTNYRYFVEEIPRLIINRDANLLIGAGDFTEGLKHNLSLRKEVFGGLNQTDQEKLAGILVGEVLLRVFQAKIDSRLQKRRLFSGSKLQDLINDSLIDFLYIYGNHCAWTQDMGFDPLGIFRIALINHLTKGIEEYLGTKNLRFNGIVRKIVIKHIIEQKEGRESYRLPSGLDVQVFHPWMARTITQSIRPQQTLAFADSQIVVSANFHVAIGVGEWRQATGQRYGLQVGTVKDRSDFESHKLKKLDTGTGCLRTVSIGGRIWMTEMVFDNAKPSEPLDNDQLVPLVCNKFGVKTFPSD